MARGEKKEKSAREKEEEEEKPERERAPPATNTTPATNSRPLDHTPHFSPSFAPSGSPLSPSPLASYPRLSKQNPQVNPKIPK